MPRSPQKTLPLSSTARSRVGLAALVLTTAACTSGPHRHTPETTSTTTAATTTTTTEPAQQFAPSPYTWMRSTSAALSLDGGPTATLSSVLAPISGGQWEVFGSRLGATGASSASVWTSADTTRWAVAALPSGSLPSHVDAATRYKSATVAVGSSGAGGSEQAAVWLSSSSGAPYVEESVQASDSPSSMTIVAAGALGMFSAGSIDGRFALWSSTNGRQWEEIPAAERVIEGSSGAQVNAMLAAGDNVYAAGSIQVGPLRQPALWSTSDGINWHLVGSAQPSFAGPTNRVIYSLAPLGTGLVAVGAVERGTRWVPASWISPEGQSWSLASSDFAGVPAARSPQVPGDGTAARSVSAVSTLLGSTEVVAAGGGPDGQAVWQSSDGLHWSSLALAPQYAGATSWRAELAAATIDTAVVMDAEPGQPYLLSESGLAAGASRPPSGWSQPSADPAEFGPIQPEAVPVAMESAGGHVQLTVEMIGRPQVIGPAATASAVLSSTDGKSWSATPAIPGPSSLPSPGALVLKVPTGWIAVASRPGAAPTTWTSKNGATWVPAGALELPSPSTAASTTTSATATSTRPTPQASIAIHGLCAARVHASATTSSFVAAAVGSVLVANPSAPVTAQAAAWTYAPGQGWQNTPITSSQPAGTAASMSGCVGTATGLVAYGAGASPGGAPAPATWKSADGASWTRLTVNAFAAGTPGPLASLATDGDNWLAAGRPDADTGPGASLQNGQEGLWLSTDAGSTWQAIDTYVDPWLKADRSELYLVTFAAGTPVVAGVVDGQLAVWTGV